MTTTISDRADFAAGAARLGLTPDQIGELVGLRHAGDCGRVQNRMAEFVAQRLDRAEADLEALYAEQAAAGGVLAPAGVAPIADTIPLTQHIARLQRARDVLSAEPRDGDCPCTRAAGVNGGVYVFPTATGRPTIAADGQPIMCTLDADGGDMAERLHDWRAILAQANGRETLDNGVAVTFDHDVARTADLARLMASEYACCSFGSYHLTIDGHGVRMEIRVPPEAHGAFAAVFGDAAGAP
jgi:hypothetical protein